MPPVVGIDERASAFFEDVIRFTQTIPSAPGTLRLIEQLVQTSGSIAANRQEATSASSKKEFIRFNKIALRSAKETTVWLRGCRAGEWGDQEECRRLLDESQQITRILAAIVIKAQRNLL
jgi:four helix bundle protein